ncbi:hypothetical protein H4S07_003466 [Coemansia furcata]|uniref:Uncharacterized protein n=1 Tax=Coemansia furcata TaxID=417177 RepID=A0ACC1LHX1_9FUNG|nr:hypothetical protein H4S07_003466 [Coemansia furcata]
MGPIRQAYMMWKALRLPWRRDVLAGVDLDGNLYFERSAPSAQRTRRHVLYKKNITVSEYNDQIIPIQWQAWMRHTRSQPPTIQELLHDVERRRRMAENVHSLAAKEKNRTSAVSGPEAVDIPQNSRSQPQTTVSKTSAPGETFEPEGWVPARSKKVN